jgi:hypothetical protein
VLFRSPSASLATGWDCRRPDRGPRTGRTPTSIRPTSRPGRATSAGSISARASRVASSPSTRPRSSRQSSTALCSRYRAPPPAMAASAAAALAVMAASAVAAAPRVRSKVAADVAPPADRGARGRPSFSDYWRSSGWVGGVRAALENWPGLPECSVNPTGGWQTRTETECGIEPTPGVHGVYPRFAGTGTEVERQRGS